MRGDAGRSQPPTVGFNARELRLRRGWTLAEAAQAAGIGKSTLAQLETGTANPSLETFWAVASAYGVPVGSLIGSLHGRSRLVRAVDRVPVHSAHHEYKIQMLLSLGPLTGLDVTLLETEPGEPRVSEPHVKGSIEHINVVNGTLRISPGDGTTSDLGEGDLLSLPWNFPHSYETLAPGTRAVVIVQYSSVRRALRTSNEHDFARRHQLRRQQSLTGAGRSAPDQRDRPADLDTSSAHRPQNDREHQQNGQVS